MTMLVLKVLLLAHLAIVPVFLPKVSGIHSGHLTISNAPAWSQIYHTGDLQQPDGAMIIWRGTF